MQICDNKQYLGKIFELGKEAVGFDTIEECQDLCRYYLAHDEERRIIAANGWKRALTDYTELAVFSRNINIFINLLASKTTDKNDASIRIALQQLKSTTARRLLHSFISSVSNAVKRLISSEAVRSVVSFLLLRKKGRTDD
jgi:vacuolar-type H+-ATPase subunit C/Vma6